MEYLVSAVENRQLPNTIGRSAIGWLSLVRSWASANNSNTVW